MPIADFSVEAFVASHVPLSENSDRTETSVRLDLREVETFAEGNFSKVCRASLSVEGDSQTVAVKTCTQPSTIKCREVSILRGLTHPNVLKLLYYWTVTKPDRDTQLNMVLEYLPETLYQKQLLKLGDFGSAKVLKEGEKNSSVAYIVSRHYRAPELLLGNKKYSFQVDMWSVGCVMGELLQKSVLFPGSNQTEQMRLILSILGSPTFAEMDMMQPGSKNHLQCEVTADDRRLSSLRPASWTAKFSKTRDDITRPVINLIKGLLQFCPTKRLTAHQAVKSSLFVEDVEPASSANLRPHSISNRQTVES